ncbi:sugar ABC transporter substrate-binding protein [Glaciihabitans sp. dw_435]|uniref:sugar ABC transporter substrate-binding protein n=1 Tax=Glaciihabitans sp. dw_435 TaxID=2720081 RepID=UPI0021046EDE|nr:sugar ABC transporter substrate-binding protein [Glaciihabitans sp. dw_435]
MHQRFRPVLTMAAVGIASALLLSGCSTETTASVSSSTTDEGVAYATAQIEKFSVDPAFTLDAPAFPLKDIAGKTIFNIPNTSGIPFIVTVDEEAKKVAETYGAKWVEYTNQGSPTEHTAGIDQAISQKADVIMLSQGINGELLIPALQRAKAAGIPVVITHTYEDGDPIPDTLKDLVAAQITAPFNESGRLSADWAIKQTKGKGNILLINTAEVPVAQGIIDAMKDEIATHCPDCTVKDVNVPIADWATKISTTVQSEIQINPELDYVLPVFDSMSLFVEAGVTAAGKVGSVFTASFNGTPAVLKIMQDGEVLTMDAGESMTWLAWASIDQVGRVLTGSPIIEDGAAHTPLKVITKDNVDETGTPPEAGKGYGDAFETGYKALWGQP